MTSNLIGIFDSGVGGLSVLKAIRQELPGHPVVYLADQAHVPYGSRPLDEVRRFSEAITRFLLSQGAKLIVVACNTASAAALHPLRKSFPGVPFVGMEPAVKPAAESTHSKVVGVLATPATFQGALYASVIERFARGVTVLQHTCPGLVAQIEAGALCEEGTRRILKDALDPMLERGIDTVVLGCTHYSFVIPMMQDIVGPGVRVIDPAPAVARQARRLLEGNKLHMPAQPGQAGPAPARFLTSGERKGLQALLPRLLGEEGVTETVKWEQDTTLRAFE
jgi:glutamate racemase